MAQYFLDTHIVTWLLTENKQLDKNLRFDIQYPHGDQYLISEFVIMELTHLKQLGKIQYKGSSMDLFNSLASINIKIEPTTQKVFESLEKLPILTINRDHHTEMIDRIIIADCIAYKYTMISHDQKFPYYREYGLKLLEA